MVRRPRRSRHRGRPSPSTPGSSAYWPNNTNPSRGPRSSSSPRQAADHRRLAQLYVIASQCHAAGRIDDAVRFADSGLIATGSGRFDEVPFGLEAAIVAVYSMVGHPEVAVIPLRKMIARTPGTHILERSCLVLALVNAGAGDEARAEAEGLLAAAETTDTPNAKSLALTAYSWAFHDADPANCVRRQSPRPENRPRQRLPVPRVGHRPRPVAASRRPARSRGSLRLFNHCYPQLSRLRPFLAHARTIGDPRHHPRSARALPSGGHSRRIRRRRRYAPGISRTPHCDRPSARSARRRSLQILGPHRRTHDDRRDGGLCLRTD